MGVSGCGKSTIGEHLAKAKNISFYDGDAFHPQANIDKMAVGTPLNDDDREPWLQTLAKIIADSGTPCVIACSALKKSYRNILRQGGDLRFVYLEGSKEVLLERLKQRSAETDHFMPSSLLNSQLATLDVPTPESDVITVNINQSPQQIIQHVQHSN